MQNAEKHVLFQNHNKYKKTHKKIQILYKKTVPDMLGLLMMHLFCLPSQPPTYWTIYLKSTVVTIFLSLANMFYERGH